MAENDSLTDEQRQLVAEKTSFSRYVSEHVKSFLIKTGSAFTAGLIGRMLFSSIDRGRLKARYPQRIDLRSDLTEGGLYTVLLRTFAAVTAGSIGLAIGGITNSFRQWRRCERGVIEADMALRNTNALQNQSMPSAANVTATQDYRDKQTDDVTSERPRTPYASSEPPATHTERASRDPDKQRQAASV